MRKYFKKLLIVLGDFKKIHARNFYFFGARNRKEYNI